MSYGRNSSAELARRYSEQNDQYESLARSHSIVSKDLTEISIKCKVQAGMIVMGDLEIAQLRKTVQADIDLRSKLASEEVGKKLAETISEDMDERPRKKVKMKDTERQPKKT